MFEQWENTEQMTRAVTTYYNMKRRGNATPAKRDATKPYKKPRLQYQQAIVAKPETKTKDIAATLPDVTCVFLSGVAQGLTATTRIGNNCQLLKVNLRWLATQTVAGGVPASFRLLVFTDNATNGAVVLSTDVLAAATTTSFSNVFNRGRFQFLSDEYHHLNYYVGTTTGNTQLFGKYQHTFKKPHIMQFLSTLSTLGGSQRGGVFAMVVMTSPATLVIDYECRVKFVDM